MFTSYFFKYSNKFTQKNTLKKIFLCVIFLCVHRSIRTFERVSLCKYPQRVFNRILLCVNFTFSLFFCVICIRIMRKHFLHSFTIKILALLQCELVSGLFSKPFSSFSEKNHTYILQRHCKYQNVLYGKKEGIEMEPKKNTIEVKNK